MKKYLLSALLLLTVIILKAQTSEQKQDQGERLAKKIAKHLKDSLNLTGSEMNRLYTINLSLHQQKKQLMGSGQSREVIAKGLQRIENSRDSLYKQVIPEDKYKLYRSKKRNLVNNNMND